MEVVAVASLAFLLFGTVVANAGEDPKYDPLPRAPRRRNRNSADKGLPEDSELERLAQAYLDTMRQLWPELAKRGVFPKPTKAICHEMAEDFKVRHRGGPVLLAADLIASNVLSVLAGCYARFSCDNSNPLSIADQVTNCLKKAKTEGHVIPWSYLFADYAVSGLKAARQGYTSYKATLQSQEHRVGVSYIDDFTRASRDELEWWKLAALSKRLRKNLITASDGFVLFSEQGEVMMYTYGLLSKFLIRGIRQKVRRGMTGAASRGTVLGRIAIGHTRRVRLNEHGRPERHPDGSFVHEICIDPVTADAVRWMFDSYAILKWSYTKIAKECNRRKIDGCEHWTAGTIRKRLSNASAVGKFIWNKTRREPDPETGLDQVVKNPRKEWNVRYAPELALIPMELWLATRRRAIHCRRQHPAYGRRGGASSKPETTLFSKTLVCKCGKVLTLLRSQQKYKNLHCSDGASNANGCALNTSKSTKIIESCLLNFLQSAILAPAALDEVISQANVYLAELASRPRLDVAPMEKQLRQIDKKLSVLLDRVVEIEDDDVRDAYDAQIKKLQRQKAELNQGLVRARAANAAPPPPLDPNWVKAQLCDLRSLLSDEIPAAAEALRSLTGKIEIRQERDPSRTRGARWIAEFQPDVIQFLRHATQNPDCPHSVTLEFLCARKWTTPKKASITIEEEPKYAVLAEQVAEGVRRGVSLNAVAASLGITWQSAKIMLTFATTGQRPRWPSKKRATGKGSPTQKYRSIAAEVARMRDALQMNWPAIIRSLKDAGLNVSESTVRRAYDHAHAEAVKTSVAKGESPHRGSWRMLAPEKVAEMQDLIRQGGLSVREIAVRVGVGQNTVRREQARMQQS